MARHRMDTLPMDSREMSGWGGSYGRSGPKRPGPAPLHVRPSRPVFRPSHPLLLPLRIRPCQEILGAGTAQMRAAVLHHHLAIDVASGIRNQEARQIGKLTMPAAAAERISGCPVL